MDAAVHAGWGSSGAPTLAAHVAARGSVALLAGVATVAVLHH